MCSFSGDDRSKRSTRERKIRDTTKDTDVYKYLEGALIVPKSYEEKYGKDKFATVLLVIANLVRIRMCVTTHTHKNPKKNWEVCFISIKSADKGTIAS